MTFSIAAADPATGELGVAVASKFLAVGSVVPACMPAVGAIATQSYANVQYGPDGLMLLADGVAPDAVVARLTGADEDARLRQLGVVDAAGRAATFTGDGCFAWAGGVTGDGYAIQGNILAGDGVVPAMEAAWLAAAGQPFADRLLAALLAGDRAGGDSRGRQSASLTVVQPGAGYGGSGVQVDLRVDDHPDPVPELVRLLAIHVLLFGTTLEDEWLAIDEPLAAELRAALGRVGHPAPAGTGLDAGLQAALDAWVGNANLEERYAGGPRIDPLVVAELRRAAAL